MESPKEYPQTDNHLFEMREFIDSHTDREEEEEEEPDPVRLELELLELIESGELSGKDYDEAQDYLDSLG